MKRTSSKVKTKRYIDSQFNKLLFFNPVVDLIAWTPEELAEYKLVENNKYLRPKNKCELPNKKQKLSDEKDKTVLKSVYSRDGKFNTFNSQLKTTITNNEESSKINLKKSDTKEYYKNKNDDNNDMDTAITIESIDEHTDFSNEPPVEVLTSSVGSKVGKISAINMMKIIKPHLFEHFNNACISKTTKRVEIKSKSIIPVSLDTHSVNTTKQLSLCEVESLYQKYFSKTAQDYTVIIANILHIIFISNKHHKERIEESFKNNTEAEKLKEQCDANRIHLKRKKILESALKKYFLLVITNIAVFEFEHAFQIFFLGVLNIFRIVDQPELKKGGVFKSLVLLLWNSLLNSEFNHAKIYEMFRSKTFRPDCIDLISLIEDARDSDPGIIERMALFFVSSVNSQAYFQLVINAVTSDSNDNLALLIDNAADQCIINSIFKSYSNIPSSTIVKEVVNSKTPAPATQSFMENGDSVQQWVQAETQGCLKEKVGADGHSAVHSLAGQTIRFKPMPAADFGFKTNSPTTQENIKGSQDVNSSYESFSDSIPKVSNIDTVPNLVVPKKIIASSPNILNGISKTKSIFITLKPTLESVKCTTTTTTSTATRPAEANSIYIGNKKYTVIRSSNVNPIRVINTIQNNVVTTQVTEVMEPSEINSSICFARHCENQPTILCSICRSVNYCSINCQESDWYDAHIHCCERLSNIRLNSQKATSC